MVMRGFDECRRTGASLLGFDRHPALIARRVLTSNGQSLQGGGLKFWTCITESVRSQTLCQRNR